jgi:hypothetical protein
MYRLNFNRIRFEKIKPLICSEKIYSLFYERRENKGFFCLIEQRVNLNLLKSP